MKVRPGGGGVGRGRGQIWRKIDGERGCSGERERERETETGTAEERR